MDQLFRIKICGVTNLADATASAEAGADAIGLNFYEKSPRYVPIETAKAIAAAVGNSVTVVGVFVNADVQTIRDVVTAVPLNAVQLHGDEPAEVLAELRGLSVVRAFRPQGNLHEIDRYLNRCRELKAFPAMALIDAWNPRAFGGTGERADWSLLADNRSSLESLPIVLAGGLNPTNVAAAIRQVRPAAVDTASGVEESPGRKSAEKIRAFVTEAREAFAGLRSNG